MIKQLVNYIHYNVDELKLKFAIYMAVKTHEQNGKRYFVMPDERDRLIIMHRPPFRKLKHIGQMSYAAKVNNLTRESFYFTPYSVGIKKKNNHPAYCNNRNSASYCTVETGAIAPEIQEVKRLMLHRYMREPRIRKKNTLRLPFLSHLKIKLEILAIQYKMAVR